MAISKRVEQVRNALGLTQVSFSRAIGITQGTLSSMERGNIAVSERNIKFICQEFGVNEKWLREGTGEMFNRTELSLLELLGERISKLSDIEKKAITEFIKLPDEHREIIMGFIKKMAN